MFWLCAFFIFYSYFGYLLLLMAISNFRNRPVLKGGSLQDVSFIITAHNEESRIREKIENTLSQDFPKDLLEVIVASDASTDNTDMIVSSFKDKGVTLVKVPERKGKEYAQKKAIERAKNGIMVFSDTATILKPDAVRNIIKPFNDPTVGCVSSVDRFIEDDGKTNGEGAYVRYEMRIRELETRVNTLVGLSGSFFAARRAVCDNWAVGLQSDFNTLLNSVRLGLRGVSDPESIGYYKNIKDESKEYQRKVRTVLRGISVLMQSLPLLDPFKYGFFSLQLFSHKLCRWLTPYAMVILFLCNLPLAPVSAFYAFTLLMQIAFYCAAIAGRYHGGAYLKLPYFLVMSNLSILDAWFRYMKGERLVFWEPSKR